MCRRSTVDEAYEIVTDHDAATDAAWEAIETGDPDRLGATLTAAPHLFSRPFLTPALLACALLLSPAAGQEPTPANSEQASAATEQTDQLRELARAAAAQGNDTQRRALAARLRRLKKRRPDLSPGADLLIAVLTED